MSLSIAGKTAIVTGGAKGIGLAIGRHFVEQGARVMFADADEERLVAEMGDEAGDDGPIRYFGGDLAQKLSAANLLSATIDAFERIDILVNASRQFLVGDPLNPDDDTLETLLRQNTLASIRLSQLVARRMIAQAEKDGQDEGEVGAIVNLSTIVTQRSQPALLAFSVSGAALDQATRSLSLALAPHRIRVNGVAFGSVMSASLQALLKENSDWRAEIEGATPLGRIATAQELVETVQFLASTGSGFMTGQVLTVDGGRTLVDPVTASAY
jgi:7-alpha-hydroxysteroid dehydrogenase